MKKLITAVCVTALALSSGLTSYAAETLDRDYIESEIWEEVWLGKGDNGTDFPEASYKHHLLDQWLDENYGSDDYDWSALGELKYSYKDYYNALIENWDFNDDENGGWTIQTEDNYYSFYMQDGMWQMIDQNGDTVDSFPPFSTLEEDMADTTGSYLINDNGADSSRVIGKVENRTEETFEESTANAAETVSESDSEPSGINPLLIIAVVAAAAGIGGAGYYIIKKRK